MTGTVVTLDDDDSAWTTQTIADLLVLTDSASGVQLILTPAAAEGLRAALDQEDCRPVRRLRVVTGGA